VGVARRRSHCRQSMGWGAPAAAGAPGGTASPSSRRTSAAFLLPPRRGLLQQYDPPRDIFGHALAIVVQVAQAGLRLSIALVRCLLVQLRRPLVALGHALALEVQGAQVVLRTSIALRSLLIQLSRPLLALGHTLVIAGSQFIQRNRLAPLSACHELRGGILGDLGRAHEDPEEEE